jgi:hypothetical protein
VYLRKTKYCDPFPLPNEPSRACFTVFGTMRLGNGCGD